MLHADPAYDYKSGTQLTIRRGIREEKKTFLRVINSPPKWTTFSQCVIENHDPEPSGAEGLADVRIICAIDKAARRGSRCQTEALQQDKASRPAPGDKASTGEKAAASC